MKKRPLFSRLYRAFLYRIINSPGLFNLFERFGIHITVADFYSPIPTIRELPQEIYRRTSPCHGINFSRDRQASLLTDIFSRYAREEEFPKNPGLSRVDAAVLHCMIRHYKPGRIVEIGSGESTRFIAAAALKNQNESAPPEVRIIDPYPRYPELKDHPAITEFLTEKVQQIPTDILIDTDLLFIDSSHVSKIGSDVNHLIFDVLPQLKKGCLVHFHDILLPREYWRDWMEGAHYFWNEQYLLQAFLTFNDRFSIVWAAHFMQEVDPEGIKSIFPFFEITRHRLSSFWIQRMEK